MKGKVKYGIRLPENICQIVKVVQARVIAAVKAVVQRYFPSMGK